VKLILGSGVVGLMARFLLGDSWTVVPFGKSRFYSFNPPLDDNFVSHDRQLDPLMAELGLSTTPVWLQRAYSLGGQLLREDRDGSLAQGWLSKIFGDRVPPHAPVYLTSRLGFFVYDQVRVNRLYGQLQNRYQEELLQQAALGAVTELGDHYIIRGGKRQDFERAVTTIPHGSLLRLMGRPDELPYSTNYCIHMATPSLDFEGATQVMVVDPIFGFYKVSLLAKQRYLFHLHQDLGDHAGAYFMPIIKDYDLLDGTSIPGGIPLGPMPDLAWLERLDVFPVGSYAQHDWCADVGSNFLRLLKYAGRGEQRQPSHLIVPRRFA
jgi:hypothetical protein